MHLAMRLVGAGAYAARQDMDERRYAHWGRVLLQDGRQGIVGGIALLAAGGVGAR